MTKMGFSTNGPSAFCQGDKMLYIIQNCQPNEFEDDIDKISALANLLRAHYFRKNIVFADQATLENVKDSSNYGKIEKLSAQDILEHRREIGGLKNSLSHYAMIDFSPKGPEIYQKTKNVFQMNYEHFIHERNSSPTVLVTENYNDYLFYQMLAEYHSKYISKQDLRVNLDFTPGGGSQSKVEFDRCIIAGKFTLCFIDSDKKHPNGSEGETSKCFTKEDKSGKNRCFAKVLDVKEIECLIPLHLLEEIVIEKINEKVDLIDEIKSYAEKNNSFQDFFDFKDGIDLKEAIKLDEKYGPFWLTILQTNKKFSDKECVKNKVCYQCTECPKVGGVSESILPKILTKMRTSHKRNFRLEGNLKQHWESIGEIMLNWGCTLKAKPIRS